MLVIYGMYNHSTNMMENFDPNHVNCVDIPYSQQCSSYYDTLQNQADAVFNRFVEYPADFKAYQWLLQYNNIRYQNCRDTFVYD